MAWTILGYTNPYNQYGDSYGYNVMGSDTAGGLLIRRVLWEAHEVYSTEFAVNAEGVTRQEAIGSGFCSAFEPCTETDSYGMGGVLHSPEGAAYSAADISVLYTWNRQLPAGADPSIDYRDVGPSASNGNLTVFSVSRHWTEHPTSSLVALLDATGATRWTRVFDDYFYSAQVDDSGATIITGLYPGAPLVIGPDGTTLYPLSRDLVGGGRTYKSGDSTLLDVLTQQPSAVLPFVPQGKPLLMTASRIIVSPQDQPDTLVAVDLPAGTIAWQRQVQLKQWFPPATDGTLLMLDTNQILHLVKPDGTDSLACTLPDGFTAYAPVLVGDNHRLVFSNYGNIEAYDLPH